DQTTSIAEQNGQLVVMQRPEVHEKIAQLLRSIRDTQTLQVLTNVRFVDVTDQFLERIGIHFTGLDAPVGATALPNVKVDPLNQPSKFGLFPIGGGPGLPAGTTFGDTQPSPAFQFANFLPVPPFQRFFGPASGNIPPNNQPIFRPRLDNNFPGVSQASNNTLAGGAAGILHQWFSNIFGSPTLFQGLTQNLIQFNPLGANTLGAATSAQEGAIFQFRFLQATQTNAVLM